MSVQPGGGLIVELPRMATVASRRSPAADVVGRARTRVVVIAPFVAYDADLNTGDAPGATSVTVQLKVSVASTPPPSLTVTLTAYGLPAAAGRGRHPTPRR